MKRSEMLSRLKARLKDYKNYNTHVHYIEEDLSNFILDYIESQGMRPKGYHGLAATAEKYDSSKHVGRDIIKFNMWEPENDREKEESK